MTHNTAIFSNESNGIYHNLYMSKYLALNLKDGVQYLFCGYLLECAQFPTWSLITYNYMKSYIISLITHDQLFIILSGINKTQALPAFVSTKQDS